MNDLIERILADRYRVDAFIGRGGMADVYRVWDSQRLSFLAMKLLHEDLSIDRVFMRRFKREAHTLSRLQHPNIVRFYGLVQDKDLSFILLDYIKGSSLKRVIYDAGGSLQLGQVRTVMQSICSALQYAHGSGFIHCDIKPGNIMVNRQGDVLLTDFGVARMSDAATATMVGVGTPAYMAPEQIHGQDPSPQTDIYALGIVLYEMLTGGERPFTGDYARTTGSTSEKVRWEQMHLNPLKPRTYSPSIPIEVENVVLKCLEKDPDHRYPSALDLLNAFVRAVPGVDESPIPIGVEVQPDVNQPPETKGTTIGNIQNRIGRFGIVLIGAVVVVIITLILMNLGERDQPTSSGFQTAVVVSDLTDSDRLKKSNKTNIRAKKTTAVVITSTDIITDVSTVSKIKSITPELKPPSDTPTPSPSRTNTNTTTPTPSITLTLTPSRTASHTPTRTLKPSGNYDLAFSSDQDGEFAVYLMNSSTMDFIKMERPSGYERIFWPSFCGSQIAVEAQDTGGSKPQWIYLNNFDGSIAGSFEALSGVGELGVPRCHPDMDYIAYSGSKSGKWDMYISDSGDHFKISPSNSRIVGYTSWLQTGINSLFQVIETDGKNVIYKLLGVPGNWSYAQVRQGGNPALSADGNWITYSCKNVGTNDRMLCLVHPDGSEKHDLVLIQRTSIPGVSWAQPVSVWSADGQWIYFASADDGDWDIYRIRPDGSDKQNMTNDWDSSHEIMPAIKW